MLNFFSAVKFVSFKRSFPVLPGLVLAFSLTSGMPNAIAQQVPVREILLANGMKLLLVERHDEPVVAGGWVAHVGAANERPGITGIAHLFEHMMFKGTRTIGTSDYEKDLQILAEQEKIRDQMREEEAKMRIAFRKGDIDDLLKPESKTARWNELNEQFKKLVDDERKVLVKNEFDKVYTSAGGSGMNAFTTQDMTCYFIKVPSNKLELWMWMESERIKAPVFREFYSERDVVFEERRMRTDSTPTGKFEEEAEAMTWQSVPYHWQTIGWPSDISSISKAQADEFYGIYYSPQNITLILVGDFDSVATEKMVRRYFERIPRGPKNPPDLITTEVPQLGEKRMYADADTNPNADLEWHTVPFGHKDSYPLKVLAQILSSRTGRLYKGLVLGSQLATSVEAGQDSRKWAGLFGIGGEVRDPHTPEELEKGIYVELDKLRNTPVPAEELQKVKNQFAAAEFRKLASDEAILHQLMICEGERDWHEFNESGAKIQSVTAEDIQRVVKKYFTRENRVVVIFNRKADAAADTDSKPKSL